MNLQESFALRFNSTRLSGKSTEANVFYKLGKRYDAQFGYEHSLSISSSNKAGHYHVLSTGITRSTKTSTLKIDFRVNAEYHFKPQKKYRWRILPQIRIRPKSDFIGISPFISCRLYYFYGGEALKMYNHKGEVMKECPPYGFHRVRLNTGFVYKINKSLFFKSQLSRQQEFNTMFAYKHRINILNPETGKIKRAFNNYWLIGCSLTYVIKHKGGHTKKKLEFDGDQLW